MELGFYKSRVVCPILDMELATLSKPMSSTHEIRGQAGFIALGFSNADKTRLDQNRSSSLPTR